MEWAVVEVAAVEVYERPFQVSFALLAVMTLPVQGQ